MRYPQRYPRYYVPRQSASIDLMRDGSLCFRSSYDAGLVAALKAAIPYSDRKWEPKDKVWLVAPQWASTLAGLAEQHLGVRPKVPQIQSAAPSVETRLLDMRYLGAAKDRGQGEQSSYGWVNGQWSAIFPLTVLQEWFNMEQKPGESPTLYAVLGVKRSTSASELKSAFRRAARQWHPDVCDDPGAEEQFKTINHAYEVLKDPQKRRKYDAGLALAANVSKRQASSADFVSLSQYGWRPPLRCGYVLCEGQEQLGRFVVSKILQWEDVVDSRGRVLVTSWRYGDDTFTERWI